MSHSCHELLPCQQPPSFAAKALHFLCYLHCATRMIVFTTSCPLIDRDSKVCNSTQEWILQLPAVPAQLAASGFRFQIFLSFLAEQFPAHWSHLDHLIRSFNYVALGQCLTVLKNTMSSCLPPRGKGFAASAAAFLLVLAATWQPSTARLVNFCSVDVRLISVHDLDFKTLQQANNVSSAMLKLADGWLSVRAAPRACMAQGAGGARRWGG